MLVSRRLAGHTPGHCWSDWRFSIGSAPECWWRLWVWFWPSTRIRCSIVVDIFACHAEDPGSIPGGGVLGHRAILQATSLPTQTSAERFCAHALRSFPKKALTKQRAAPGIEPGASRTRSENHATRPSSQLGAAHSPVHYAMCSRRRN